MKYKLTFVTLLTTLVVLTASNVMAQANSVSAGTTGYSLPQSYYNSLKGGNAAQPTAEVASNAPVPVETNSATATVFAPEPAQVPQQNMADSQPVVQASVPQNEAPLATDYTIPDIMTSLGQLRTELNEIRNDSKQSDAGEVAGYKGGFYIKSRDDNFRLNFGFRAQVRYSFNLAEDVQDGHTLSLRRAFIFIHGNAHKKKATYFFLLAPNYSPGLIYFDVGYDFSPYFGLHATYDSLPAINEVSQSSGKLSFISKSLIANRFDIGSYGVYATGGHKWFSYIVGVYNGVDSGLSANANQELAYGARFDFKVLNSLSSGMGDLAHSDKPAVAVGLGGMFGHFETGQQARLMMGTADIRFKYKGFSLTMAGVYRQIDPDQFSRAQTDVAFAIYGSYFVIPKKFEIALRYSALFDDITDAGVNINMSGGNRSRLGGALSGGDVGGDSDNEWDVTVGFNWYIIQNKVKLQAEYLMMVDGIAGPDDLVNHIGMVQAQLGF